MGCMYWRIMSHSAIHWSASHFRNRQHSFQMNPPRADAISILQRHQTKRNPSQIHFSCHLPKNWTSSNLSKNRPWWCWPKRLTWTFMRYTWRISVTFLGKLISSTSWTMSFDDCTASLRRNWHLSYLSVDRYPSRTLRRDPLSWPNPLLEGDCWTKAWQGIFWTFNASKLDLLIGSRISSTPHWISPHSLKDFAKLAPKKIADRVIDSDSDY